jgi:hypothetical protein
MDHTFEPSNGLVENMRYEEQEDPSIPRVRYQKSENFLKKYQKVRRDIEERQQEVIDGVYSGTKRRKVVNAIQSSKTRFFTELLHEISKEQIKVYTSGMSKLLTIKKRIIEKNMDEA